MTRWFVGGALVAGLSAQAGEVRFTHQGRLLEASGVPVTGSHGLTVSLYPTSGSTTPVWRGEFPGLAFDGGLFHVTLTGVGALGTDLDAVLAANDDLWMGLSVDGAAELSPRERFDFVPLAARALRTDGVALEDVTSGASCSLTGGVAWDSAESTLYVCNGTTWGGLGAGLVVTGSQPASGSIFGNNTLTVFGSGFAAGATVTVGGVAATNVLVTSPNQLTATVPAGSGTGLAVAVTVGGTTRTLPAAYSYTPGSLADFAAATLTSGNYTPSINGVSIPVEFIRVTGSTTLSTSTNYGSSTPDDRLVVVRYDGDLTVGSGATVTTTARKLGLYLYVGGNTTINGTVSMTARGAAGVAGQNVLLASGVSIPASGAGGAAGTSATTLTNGAAGSNGAAGQSGGGGAGGDNGHPSFAGITSSGSGAAGTSYSGGAGGGGRSHASTGSGTNGGANGGTGGNGGNAGGGGASSAGGGGGGAGNPGGTGGTTSGGSVGSPGSPGTGGLLAMFVKGNVAGTGTLSANGSAGGAGGSGSSQNSGGGAGSGGGNVTLVYNGTTSFSGSLTATGGAGGAGSGPCNGGAGGNGSTRTIDLE